MQSLSLIPPKAILLYIHPGIHNDFSPRWDRLLYALADEGYLIVAPNYPMSFGYGKNYHNQEPASCISDIRSWKNYLRSKYSGVPFFYLTLSSGNILMEAAIGEDAQGIDGAISILGIPAIGNSSAVEKFFVLGENDPLVDFSARKSQLEAESASNGRMQMLYLKNEGHWIRHLNNQQLLLNRINQFVCKCSP